MGHSGENDALAAIREALQDSNVSLRLVHTFTHGRAVQVMVKSRKVGPLLFPPDDGTVADTLRMLGDMACFIPPGDGRRVCLCPIENECDCAEPVGDVDTAWLDSIFPPAGGDA